MTAQLTWPTLTSPSRSRDGSSSPRSAGGEIGVRLAHRLQIKGARLVTRRALRFEKAHRIRARLMPGATSVAVCVARLPGQRQDPSLQRHRPGRIGLDVPNCQHRIVQHGRQVAKQGGEFVSHRPFFPAHQLSLIHSTALSSPMCSDALSISSATQSGAASTIPRKRCL